MIPSFLIGFAISLNKYSVYLKKLMKIVSFSEIVTEIVFFFSINEDILQDLFSVHLYLLNSKMYNFGIFHTIPCTRKTQFFQPQQHNQADLTNVLLSDKRSKSVCLSRWTRPFSFFRNFFIRDYTFFSWIASSQISSLQKIFPYIIRKKFDFFKIYLCMIIKVVLT